MSDSPYKSPQSDSFPRQPISGGGDREKLRNIAKYQRWVIYALLANIAGNILAFGTMGQGMGVRAVVGVAVLAIAVFAIVAIFLLAKEVSNVGIGVLCGVLMCVPCISLITLLIVNQMATSYLQRHGIKVGFLGVDPDSI